MVRIWKVGAYAWNQILPAAIEECQPGVPKQPKGAAKPLCMKCDWDPECSR